MSRYDIENQLSVAQAFTGGATVSTNSYKKQTAAQDISIGRLIALICLPTVAAGAGSTHTLQAIMATDAALTTSITVLATVTVLAADFILGSEVVIPIPQGVLSKQYLGFRNSSSGGSTTVTLDVYIVPQDEIPVYKPFPKAVNAET